MNPSSKFYDLIVSFEGLKLNAYKDSVGIATIGIGTIKYPTGKAVVMGDVCTKHQAFEYLYNELKQKSSTVNFYTTGLTINQNQFDALLSFTYNVGTGALMVSTLLKKIKVNVNDPSIRVEFMKWNKGKVSGVLTVLPGLTKRRAAEADLYFS